MSEFSTRSNINRAKRTADRAAAACKRSQLEKLFSTIERRHQKAMKDVEARGEVLQMVRYSARGERYVVEQPNPYLKIAMRCESQLVLISRQLGKYGQMAAEDGPIKGSARDIFGDRLEELLKDDDACVKSPN